MQAGDTDQRSDEELMTAYAGGEAECFAVLVRRHGAALLGYLRRYSGDVAAAEDLFQETFRRVHERAGSYTGSGKFRGWLYTVATNVALDGYRKQQRRRRWGKTVSLQQLRSKDGEASPESTVAVEDNATIGPQDQADLAEQQRLVRGAIAQLPEKQRATLVLAYYEKLSYKEIAEILKCSVGAVKTHMFRAVRALAQMLPVEVRPER